MKRFICIVLSTVMLSRTSTADEQKTNIVIFPDQIWGKGGYSLLDKVTLDLDGDGIMDTIKIFNIIDWNDPGDFQQLRFILSEGRTIDVYNLGDWISIDDDNLAKFRDINIVVSDRLLITKILKNKTILILFGYQYASLPGKLTILDLTNGDLRVLYQDYFDLISIFDLSNDGLDEFIGFHYYGECCCYEDSVSIGVTYRPYFVLSLQNALLMPDVTLSEEYNVNNYIGFFGLDYDSDYRYLTIYPKIGYNFKPYYYFEKYRKYPFASLKYLIEQDLIGYSKEELRIMRNEIFAFHGYAFDSSDLKEYFANQKWYKPTDKDISNRLNEFEKQNIELIKRIEDRN